MPKVLPFNPNLHPIARRLKEERIAAGFTQEYIALELGYYPREISNMETLSRMVYFQRMVDFADFLNCDLVLVPRGPRK